MSRLTADALARNLRRARQFRALTQESLAQRAGVSDRTIGYLERPDRRLSGANGPVANATLGSVLSVAHALGFEPWQLLSADFDPERPPQLASEGLRRLDRDILALLESCNDSTMQHLQRLIRVHVALGEPLPSGPSGLVERPKPEGRWETDANGQVFYVLIEREGARPAT